MGPRTPKSTTGRARPSEEEKEDALQAVVLADTFESNFLPFTLDRPRCLLPLANTPLIDYTLEYLANSGVQDVILYAGAHQDQVERYINASKWRSPTSPFKKFAFLRSSATSVGDVMRDLDQKHLIMGDFIAISGDVICNFPIEEALKVHRDRRQKDKNAIMTMLLRETGVMHPAEADTALPTFVIDPTRERCLHYEEVPAALSSHPTMDPEILSYPEIDIRQDLFDCRIDICTPDVLSLWSDNFDNQSPRRDFLYGVLKDHELNGKTVHVYVIKDHYAARAANLLSYASTSDDIVKGWSSPITLESNIVSGQKFKLSNPGFYQEDGVILSRSCHIGLKCALGQGTSVGDGSVIIDSVIGRRCNIGKNVTLSGAHVWNDVSIGDDVKILKAIIADEAVVGNNCTVEEGALVSYGVQLTANTIFGEGSRITKPADDHEEEMEDSDTKAPGLIYRTAVFAESESSLSSAAAGDSGTLSSHVASRTESFTTVMSDDDESTHCTDRFHSEAVSNLFERMQSDTKADDVRVELMGLRLGNNASEHQVRKAVAVAMMKSTQHDVDTRSATVADAVKRTLKRYQTLVQRDNTTLETTADQVDFLLHAQKDLAHRNDGGKILFFLAHDLYDMDIFGEEVFTDWWEDGRSCSSDGMRKVRENTVQFMNWLANAESEEEEEEDDE